MALVEGHLEFSGKLCRFCGGNNKGRQKEVKGKKPMKSSAYAGKLRKVFGVDVASDTEVVPPVLRRGAPNSPKVR